MDLDKIDMALRFMAGEVLVGRLDIRQELQRGNNVLSLVFLDRLGRKLSTNGLIPRLDKPVDDYRIN
jgi:hypothetical protein